MGTTLMHIVMQLVSEMQVKFAGMLGEARSIQYNTGKLHNIWIFCFYCYILYLLECDWILISVNLYLGNNFYFQVHWLLWNNSRCGVHMYRNIITMIYLQYVSPPIITWSFVVVIVSLVLWPIKSVCLLLSHLFLCWYQATITAQLLVITFLIFPVTL